MTKLRKRLLERQSEEELLRKKVKASRRGIWTQEEIDYAERWAKRMSKLFKSKRGRYYDQA